MYRIEYIIILQNIITVKNKSILPLLHVKGLVHLQPYKLNRLF